MLEADANAGGKRESLDFSRRYFCDGLLEVHRYYHEMNI